jgi:hypothetical protein
VPEQRAPRRRLAVSRPLRGGPCASPRRRHREPRSPRRPRRSAACATARPGETAARRASGSSRSSATSARPDRGGAGRRPTCAGAPACVRGRTRAIDRLAHVFIERSLATVPSGSFTGAAAGRGFVAGADGWSRVMRHRSSH